MAFRSEVLNSEGPIYFLDSFRYNLVSVMRLATLAEILSGSII